MNTEGRFGKDGRDNIPAEADPESTRPLPWATNWSELEPLYRLDEHAYDLNLNFTLSLEDWAHFRRSVDRMFAHLADDHQPWDLDLEDGAREVGGHALVSSGSRSASVAYLTTLATPAFLLRKAGAEVLRDALGLNQETRPSSSAPPTSSSSSSPLPQPLSSVLQQQDGGAEWNILPELLESGRREGEERDSEEKQEEEEKEDEEEEFIKRRTGRRRLGSAHCDCSNFLQDIPV